MSSINLAIPDAAALIFNNISDTEKEQIASMVGNYLQAMNRKSRTELLEVMREIGEEAQANGLTEEIFNDILKNG